MPPRARKTPPATDPADPALDPAEETLPDADVEPAPQPNPAADSAEDPCALCFPLGWPDGATSAGCHHGSWDREVT